MEVWNTVNAACFSYPLLGFSYILHLHSLQMFQKNTAKKEISEGPNGLIPAEGIWLP